MINDKNGFIRRFSFNDINLPDVTLWNGEISPPDIFIAAIGFENRAVAISTELSKNLSQESVSIALLACYKSNLDDNGCNDSIICDSVRKFCGQLRRFAAEDPSNIHKEVCDAIKELKGKRSLVRIVFDISGSSSTLIMSIMAAIASLAHYVHLEILYTEPEIYAPTREEFDVNLEGLLNEALSEGDNESFAEQGVSDVDVNELYAGDNAENRRNRVMAIPSFRTSRLLRCLSYTSDQPLASPKDSIYWILGEPPTSTLKWRLDLQKRIIERQISKVISQNQEQFTTQALTSNNYQIASTRNYREIVKILIETIDKFAGDNISLVHMGSKLQGIGVALTLNVRSEVTLLHASPNQFNVDKYSRGVNTLWRIEFGKLSTILGELKKIGQLELQTKLNTSREHRPKF